MVEVLVTSKNRSTKQLHTLRNLQGTANFRHKIQNSTRPKNLTLLQIESKTKRRAMLMKELQQFHHGRSGSCKSAIIEVPHVRTAERIHQEEH